MKGTYRSGRRGKPGKTKFDDWSDVTPERLLRLNAIQGLMSEEEKKDRLNKFKKTTAYSQTTCDINTVRVMIRHGEPLLPHVDIRRLRLPEYNSLVLNLADVGYPWAAEYMKELIVLDEMYTKQALEDPALRRNSCVLEQLARGLAAAEEAKRKRNATGEVQAFMNLAMIIKDSQKTLVWLVNELLEKAVELVEHSKNRVDPQTEATLRFIYSIYLADYWCDLDEAKEQLRASMDLSLGKIGWCINLDGNKDEILYLKSAVVLSTMLLLEAQEDRSTDVHLAIYKCRVALHWSRQANEPQSVASSLLTLADMYIRANRLHHVPDILDEHNKLCKSRMFNRELCEGYVLMSKYYEAVGDHAKVIQVIEELVSFALDKGLIELVTRGHLKLAEIYGQRREERMKYHASAAFKYSRALGSKDEIEMSRCVMGIALGEELWQKYVGLLNSSRYVNSEQLRTLVDWKALRLPFAVKCTNLYAWDIQDFRMLKAKMETSRRDEIDYRTEENRRKASSLAWNRFGTLRDTVSGIMSARLTIATLRRENTRDTMATLRREGTRDTMATLRRENTTDTMASARDMMDSIPKYQGHKESLFRY